MRIRTLLIANRGEIACRIARTARRLGIAPVAVHSDADADARHVREIGRSIRLGPGPAGQSYLRADAVIEAARRVGADAIHPGYGFLAESPDFARAVEAAGMVFVGPTPGTLERFGDKAAAKAEAIAAGLPVIPGSEGAHAEVEEIARAVRGMGLPVLLKAAGGGGGRGQRLVADEATLKADIEAAIREARAAFGSEGLILERYLAQARHVEVQIAGDGGGEVIHLFERDCTLQRRHQKVIEEAPAPDLPEGVRAALLDDAVRLGRRLDYRSLGTVEFLVAGEEHFFLEVNPRIQVEHPVTEEVTGLDLVELQLRVAAGEGLGLAQGDVACTGHAIEARLYAEDPAADFAPSTGRITALALPEGAVRIDSGVAEDDEISPFYDPMIAKLIARGPDRAAALGALARGLAQVAVEGVRTNAAFLRALAEDPGFAGFEGVHTRWIDSRLEALSRPPERPDSRFWRAVAAALFVQAPRCPGDAEAWLRRDRFTGWRLGTGGDILEAGQRLTLTDAGLGAEELRLSPIGPAGGMRVYDSAGDCTRFALTEAGAGRWRVVAGDEVHELAARVVDDMVLLDAPGGALVFHAAPPLTFATGEEGAAGEITAPLTGQIVAVHFAQGDAVAAGDVVAVMESMKMEIPIRAETDGVLEGLDASPGDMVDRGRVIARIGAAGKETTR